MTEPDDYRFGARLCRVCGREVQGGACECATWTQQQRGGSQ